MYVYTEMFSDHAANRILLRIYAIISFILVCILILVIYHLKKKINLSRFTFLVKRFNISLLFRFLVLLIIIYIISVAFSILSF